jgi:hypothetical protein
MPNITDAIRELIDQAALEADVSAENFGKGGIAGGGRLGVNFPLGNGRMTVGAAGGGAYNKKMDVKEFNVNRADVGYESGENRFSLDVDPNDARHNFMINYMRKF